MMASEDFHPLPDSGGDSPDTVTAEPADLVAVSPVHAIALADLYLGMIGRPPEHDHVIRTLSRKLLSGMPMVMGELVVAGQDTLSAYPLARSFPVHFRKTYYPICFHQDPAREFENHQLASAAIGVPPPIGSTRTSFRSCFIPGRPLSRIAPFHAEPAENNIALARETSVPALAGLWTLLSDVFEKLEQLHRAGLAHGDAVLHNIILSPSPLGVTLIDFEKAIRRAESDPAAWEAARAADMDDILRHAAIVETALGPQTGRLAAAISSALPRLFADPDRFAREIARRR